MISIDEQIVCIERELSLRQKLYPRWIQQERMSANQAAREINAMTEVLRTLGEVRRKSLSIKDQTDERCEFCEIDGKGNHAARCPVALEEKLTQIETWANAYPLNVFPEPDLKRAREVLEAAGMTLDAISASNMRHVLNRVMEIVRK